MKLIVLVMSLLLLVGCGSKTPYVKVDVTLNQNVELKLMRQAVIDAAAKESWDIDRKLLQEDKTHLHLSKVYKKRRTHSNKPILHKSYKIKKLFVNVLLTSQGYEITLLDERGNIREPDHVENLVQMHLHSLKEAIYASLARLML